MPIEITAPGVVPYPFGLFTVAPATTPDSPGWTGDGVWWRSVACNLLGITYDACQIGSPVPPKPANVQCGVVTAEPFTVFARSRVSTAGYTDQERIQEATDALLAGEQHAAERGLWGQLGDAVPAADATAASAQEAIAMAEAHIAALYGGTGVLHMDRYTAIMAGGALRVEGGQLRTKLGSLVVAGGGYGTPPTGPGAETTVFATGGLTVLRGDTFTLGVAHDTSINDASALVERTYLIGWDCAAVRVDVDPSPGDGGDD